MALLPGTRSKNTLWKRVLRVVRVVQLVICFPLGLYVMWTKTRWPRTIKTAVSALAALFLFAILSPLTNPPEREVGGIHLVGGKPQTEVYGPEAPADREIVEIYAPRRTALVQNPTATPEPIYVYCNRGGRYYHSVECVYARAESSQVTLEQALTAGYTRCPDCSAPASYER